MKKPARAKAGPPAKPSPKAAQPGNRPGRGKAAHAKKAPAKPAHVPAKVKQARHAAAVKASKTRAANAKKAKAHPRRQLALGSAVACCSAEALAASLRLSGWPVSDADVLALYWHTARDEHAGASILATLEAAAEFGLAGVRPVWFGQAEAPASERVLCQDHPPAGAPLGLILGLALPAPHAVLDTGSEWISWGQAWPVSAFPDAVLEEAWAVDWGLAVVHDGGQLAEVGDQDAGTGILREPASPGGPLADAAEDPLGLRGRHPAFLEQQHRQLPHDLRRCLFEATAGVHVVADDALDVVSQFGVGHFASVREVCSVARYPSGQPIRLSTTVRDVTGTLVNASALTLLVKIAQVDGTWLVTGTYSTPTNDSTGTYHQDIPVTDLTTAGHYQYTWTATGTGAGVSFGEFDVFDPFETLVLPLQDAKDALNIPQATTTSDTEIAAYVATIESCLERYTGGPLVNRTVVERAEMMSNQTVILVRQRPLVSVTSIASTSGGAIDISAGLDLDTNAGTIRRKLGLPFYGPFFMWLPQVTVTYVAGWGTSVPAAFNTAARIILQNLYETQHGPSARPSMGGSDEMVTLPGFGFAIPNQAAELLDGSQGGIPFLTEAFV